MHAAFYGMKARGWEELDCAVCGEILLCCLLYSLLEATYLSMLTRASQV